MSPAAKKPSPKAKSKVKGKAVEEPRRPRGRPTKLTPDLAREICEDLRLGMPQVRAAEFAGIDATTLARWLERGAREKVGPYVELWDAVREAGGVPYRLALKAVWGAVDEDPRFAQWWLSRRDPEHFGRRDNVGASSAEDRPEPGSVVQMLMQRLERMAAATPAPEPIAEKPSVAEGGSDAVPA